jgi:hypothetical protein
MSQTSRIATDPVMGAGPCCAWVRSASLLATVSLLAFGCNCTALAADDCGNKSPAWLASPSQLFEKLRAVTNVQLLTVDLLSRQVADECAWTYEVKVLTASGSVVELEFGAGDLALVGARGPKNDRDAAALVRSLPGGADLPIISSARSGRPDSATSSTGSEGNDRGGSSAGGGGEEGSAGGGDGGEDGGDQDGGGGEDGGGEDGSGEDGGGEDGGGEDSGGEGGGEDRGGEDGGGEGGGGEGGGGEGGGGEDGGGGDDGGEAGGEGGGDD